jgi:hypothetical protein
MSHATPPATFASQRKQIARLVKADGPFVEVERAIAHGPLPPELKAELWTLAWSLLGSQRQEQQVQWITDEADAASYIQAS